jgi:hypothetical protein
MMTAILREDPPPIPEDIASALPSGLATVIHHCLEKNPAERFQNANDVAFALEALSAAPAASTAAVQQAPVVIELPARPRTRLAIAGLVVGLAAVAAAFALGRTMSGSRPEVSFTPLTHVPQTIFRALFTPDGKTVVFSAALTGTNVELFASSPDSLEPRNLGLRNVQLLSISSKSELAVLTKAVHVGQRQFVGTLARMPLGGAPREILEGVREADWAPNGNDLAIIREVNSRDRLEFPVGKVLYEVSGYLGDVRVSPDAAHIAFLEHPARYDDRGQLVVVDLTGKKVFASPEYWGLEAVAWSPAGSDVFFSGGSDFTQFVVHRATLGGNVSVALASAGGITLHDVARDGRWLAVRDEISRTMLVKGPGAREERDLTWQGFSAPAAFSSDGRTLLFREEVGVGANYAVCLRQTDGSFALAKGSRWACRRTASGCSRSSLACVNDSCCIRPAPATHAGSSPVRSNTTAKVARGSRRWPRGCPTIGGSSTAPPKRAASRAVMSRASRARRKPSSIAACWLSHRPTVSGSSSATPMPACRSPERGMSRTISPVGHHSRFPASVTTISCSPGKPTACWSRGASSRRRSSDSIS